MLLLHELNSENTWSTQGQRYKFFFFLSTKISSDTIAHFDFVVTTFEGINSQCRVKDTWQGTGKNVNDDTNGGSGRKTIG